MAPIPKLPAPEDDDPLLSKVLYAGENSAVADKDALARAKAMKEQGKDDARIWRETGWLLAKDGRWRSEIDDENAKLQPGVEKRLQEQLGKLSGRLDNFSTETYLVRDLLKHDALEAAYPEVMDMPVDVGRIWRQGGGVLKLGVFDKDMPAPETLGLGEAIPARDPFKTPQEYFQALADALKAKASTTKKRGPVIQLDLPAIASDIDDNRPGTPLGDAVRRVLVHEINHRLQDIEKFGGAPPGAREGGLGAYYADPMEIESRDAEARRDLTDQQRRELMPQPWNHPPATRENPNASKAPPTEAPNAPSLSPMRHSIGDHDDEPSHARDAYAYELGFPDYIALHMTLLHPSTPPEVADHHLQAVWGTPDSEPDP